MALDFQQVRIQIQAMGENAPVRQQILDEKRSKARILLQAFAVELDHLRHKIQRVVSNYDPNLRCALPVDKAIRDPEGLLTQGRAAACSKTGYHPGCGRLTNRAGSPSRG